MKVPTIFTPITLKIKRRIQRMSYWQGFFKNKNITKTAKDNFRIVIKEGKSLVKDLDQVWAFTEIRTKSEGFLISCVEVLIAVAIENKWDPCTLIEMIDDYRLENAQIMRDLDDLLLY